MPTAERRDIVKKTMPVIILVSVLAMFILLLCQCFIQERKITPFSVDSFKNEIDAFSSNVCVQPVCSSRDAICVAKSMWIEVYGYEVLLNRPYIVSFDESSHVWLIMGNINGIRLGGVPYLLVHQDGRVIAVWHDK